MEISKQKTVIPALVKTFETSCELGVDCEFTLPDYYPEVSRILKVLNCVNISSSNCCDKMITVSGQVVLTLLYAAPDGSINSFTHYSPFVKKIDIKNDIEGVVSVKAVINYLNSKAVAPRKLEAHGSLALNISILSVNENSVLSEYECDGVYVKTQKERMIIPLTPVTKSVFVDDEITVGDKNPTIGKILRSNVFAVITECKYVSGKAVIKGELRIEILYYPADNSKPILLSENRGFSQIIDCDLVGDTIDFDVSPRIESFELRPKTSLDGEVRTVTFDAKIGLDIFTYCYKEFDYISDAFSTDYCTEIENSTVTFERSFECVNENVLYDKSFDFAGVLEDVYDVWCGNVSNQCIVEDDKFCIKGSVPIFVLGYDQSNEPVFFEKSLEFEYEHKLSNAIKESRYNDLIGVNAVNFSIGSDGKLKIAVEVNIKTDIFELNSKNAIVSISVDCDKKTIKDETSAVILYYADGETPWNIAQAYCVSPDAICDVNKFESFDQKCYGVLLIPNV